MKLSNYAVFQRNEDDFALVTMEGKLASPLAEDESVLCRVARQTNNDTFIFWEKAKVKNKRWSFDVALPVGGPYRLEAALVKKGTRPEWAPRLVSYSFIYVGDLYFMAGQSNMSGYGRDSAEDPSVLGVHTLVGDGNWQIAQQPFLEGLDTFSGMTHLSNGTSPALSFGRTLYEATRVPVGLIPCAVGGQPMERWNPAEKGDLFESLMKTKFAYVGAVKGAVWLQGCTDAVYTKTSAETYFERFKTMVSLWREAFGNIPVIIAQINRWMAENKPDSDRGYGMVRGAQADAMKEMENVWTVPTYDMGTSDGIHNNSASNVLIGKRMAQAALSGIYHLPCAVAPLALACQKVDDTHVRLSFSASSPVQAMDACPQGMDAEDENGLIPCLRFDSEGDTALVTLARPLHGPAVLHYAWRAQPPLFAIRSQHGLPLLAFYGLPITE